MILFAAEGEFPWVPVLTTASTVLAAAGGGLMAFFKLVLNHLREQGDIQHEHNKELVARFEKIDEKQETREAALRSEMRSIIDTQFSIQKETVSAVADLGRRVGELGTAVQELRTDLSLVKKDRPPGGRPNP